MCGGSGPFAHLANDLLTRLTGVGTHFICRYDAWSCMNRGVGGELSSERSSMCKTLVWVDSSIGSSGCSSTTCLYPPLSSSALRRIVGLRGTISSQLYPGRPGKEQVKYCSVLNVGIPNGCNTAAQCTWCGMAGICINKNECIHRMKSSVVLLQIEDSSFVPRLMPRLSTDH